MRLTQGIGAAVATAAAALLTLGIVVPAQAAPEDGVLASAVGMEMFDVDLGTLVAPTPVAEWSSGQDVGATHEHVDDVFKLNTSQASGLFGDSRGRGRSGADRFGRVPAAGPSGHRVRGALRFMRPRRCADARAGPSHDRRRRSDRRGRIAARVAL